MNEFWINELNPRIVATRHGCYDAAITVPQLQKMETFLDITEDQRARHLGRHPQLDNNSVFSEEDMKDICNTWMNDHTSWMNKEKLREYELLLNSTDQEAEQRAHQM